MNGKLLQPGDAHTQALSLGVFRFCYACMLFLEVCHLFYFRHLILDPIPYLQPAPSLLSILLVIWLGTIVCVIAGYRTTISCILNYLFSVIFLGTLLYPHYEYHIDYVYIGVNFLLILAPVSDRFSLDAVRRKKNNQRIPIRNYSIHINALIFIGIALIYADSVIYKFGSSMWRDGLGVWLPASLPQISWIEVPQVLLDQKWLMLLLSYLTLLFETSFPIIMWWSSCRSVLFLIGIGLHFSIGLVFPIPFFGLTYVALYLLLLPPKFWHSLDVKLQARFKHKPFNLEDRSQHRIFGLAIRDKLALTTICLAALLQTCISIGRFPHLPEKINQPVFRAVLSQITNVCVKVRTAIITPAHTLLGIADHGVFVDAHFQNYNRLFAVRFRDPHGNHQLLPLTNPDGSPGMYPSGRVWALWCFRVNGPGVSRERFEYGVKRLTAFWAYKNKISLMNAEFEVIVRPIHSSFEWKKGHLATQKQSQWRPAGTITWKEGQFQFRPQKKSSDTQNVDPKSDESP